MTFEYDAYYYIIIDLLKVNMIFEECRILGMNQEVKTQESISFISKLVYAKHRSRFS